MPEETHAEKTSGSLLPTILAWIAASFSIAGAIVIVAGICGFLAFISILSRPRVVSSAAATLAAYPAPTGGYPAPPTETAISPFPSPTGSVLPTQTPSSTTAPPERPTIVPGIKILWLDKCDPRTDPAFCHSSTYSKPLYPPELDQFYGVITALNANLYYKLPSSEDKLDDYDVVIADFCGPAANDLVIRALKAYINSGGSVIVMGNEFCQGVGPIDGKWVSSGQAASVLTKTWGISFTTDDDTTVQYAQLSETHPALMGVSELFAYRHAYLDVQSPSRVFIKMGDRPFIGLYDHTGTMIAIPDVGFHWGSSFRPETVQSDNFVFWRNLLAWLAEQSRLKRK